MAALCELGTYNPASFHQLRPSVGPPRRKLTHRDCRPLDHACNSSIRHIFRPQPRALGLANPHVYLLPGRDPSCRLPRPASGEEQGCPGKTALRVYFRVWDCYASAIPYVSYIQKGITESVCGC